MLLTNSSLVDRMRQWGSIRTARALCAHRVRYLNNFSRRWSTGRGVVDGTCWALRRYHSP